MALVTLDDSSIENFNEAIKKYGDESLKTLNETLHNFGGKLLKSEVMKLLPESGRSWSGKKTAAAKANSMLIVNSEMLAVTVKNTTGYGYLYFPNDGSNTKRHAGKQYFMEKAGENTKQEIIEQCTKNLIEKFNN